MHICRIPKHTPPLKQMLGAIAATPKDLAKAMQVSENTAKRWVKNNCAPWSVRVAIYWSTPYGYSDININATNRLDMVVSKMLCQRDYIRDLEHEVHKYELYERITELE